MRTRPFSSLIPALLAAFIAMAPAMASAAPNTGTISGTVQTGEGAPVADASVVIQGQVRMTTASDAKGAFQFLNVPAGLYSMVVTKAGFDTYRNDEVAAFIGTTESVSVVLAPSSFSSLRTIANISTREPGVAPINRSTASISTISSQVFANQGQQQVAKVLNETPGIITTPYNAGVNGNPSNGGSPASFEPPQIRGALSYETESLIDGHPVSVGSAGAYSPNLLNPWLLQDVELVKGPGSMPAEINYAINGTVNYRTLEPTAARHGSAMFGYDNWGGISTGFKATGSTANHKLGYAVGYVTDGAPGPLKNFSYNASQLALAGGPPGGPYFVNGQQLAMIGSPVGLGVAPPQFAQYNGMAVTFTDPVVGCCYKMQTGYHSTSELAKLLYNFSTGTSLKISYLGGQNTNGNGDPNAYSAALVGNTGLPAAVFAPCGSATGPLECNPFATGSTYNCPTFGPHACNTAVPFDISSVNGVGYTWTQQNLFQGEFRTTLGTTGTVLARYYTGALNQYALLGTSGSQINYSLNTYGTIPLCPTGTTFDQNPPAVIGGPDAGGWQCLIGNDPNTFVAPVNTTFTGQRVNFSTANFPNTFVTNDTMNGETLQVQEYLGQNSVTLAYDHAEQTSASAANEPSVGIIVLSPAKGSKQTFETISLRGDVILNPKLQLNLADYALKYDSHYSFSQTTATPPVPIFHDATHTYNEPRAALTWHPNGDTSVRFSTGGSVAPPYISLLSSGGTTWSQIIGGVPAAGWIQNANNGNINAETAWSYDLGLDRRIERSTSVAIDLYLTQLRNLFLAQTVSTTPTLGPAPGMCPNLPCLVSKTENLGQARYEGVEIAATHTPLFGLGWLVQGTMQRAYTYNLPKYFYCAGNIDPTTGNPVPPGPGCINNTNLAVIPNVNFGGQPTALAGTPNGIGSARVPYTTGYGELNWSGHYGQYYNLGLTYFGPNNSFNVAPFAVVSANARWSINDRGTKLQLSADNLTNAYANSFAGFFNGIPLPLVKGAQQINPLTGAYEPAPFALTPQGNYGPASIRLILVQDF